MRRGPLCILSAAVCLVLAACTSGPSAPDSGSYVEALAGARAFKDQDFRENPESPVPPEKKDTLLPLKYFPIDPAYRVPAALSLSDQRPVFEMPTSTGKPRRMQLVGTLDFTFQGQSHSLGAFVPEGTQQIVDLFVPFADMTTGTDTYPAGRYLDLTPTSTGFYTVDFNQAYNPYCAYNATYECPFPPPSNRLKVAIRAGEKIPGA
jgi:uncharacterized protein (DUF1684 family)